MKSVKETLALVKRSYLDRIRALEQKASHLKCLVATIDELLEAKMDYQGEPMEAEANMDYGVEPPENKLGEKDSQIPDNVARPVGLEPTTF